MRESAKIVPLHRKEKPFEIYGFVDEIESFLHLLESLT
jgi:hypothetical protein